ncbi:MAG: bifunctional transaldolase/phosoglucose isomerase [Isosphaeraceae bacterium]|nr:bifunctional transaldolase/phosoglucose isomerase [Isosphaeraceae bacterium]
MGHTFALGKYGEAVSSALDMFQKERAVARLWDKDATLWKSEPEHVKIIQNSLGWLRVVDELRPHANELEAFGNDLSGPGFSHVVLMGMGGSSLCTEVLCRTFVPMSGHPLLMVLDSTVPATIRRIEGAIDPAHSLFIVASKSGTTTEPSVFYSYFFDVVEKTKGPNAGENFLAITDPGTLMEAQAQRDTFRRIFLNPSDIGGRYSALSYFGMVPAALMGLDVATILDRAKVAMELCGPKTPVRQNPGAALGAALGALATQGRNKVTLITPAPFDALGLWIEQLIAESTGKEGTGILPVAGESLSVPGVYGDDRVFVQIRLPDRPGVEEHPVLQALVEAGHPVIDLVVTDVTDLSAEFFRWEVATALAGKVLGINPFDQPNVQESKDNTKALLNDFKEKGTLGEPETVASFENLTLRADPGNKATLEPAVRGKSGREAFVACLKAHFDRVKPGDYIAITQYVDELEGRDETLQVLRTFLRDTLKVATTTGYGPRFLHSTGQFHKGGPDTGVFLQLTADDGKDVPIPGQPFGFATLVKAQARGDLQSLTSRHRRAINLDLGPDVDLGLKRLLTLIKEAVAK